MGNQKGKKTNPHTARTMFSIQSSDELTSILPGKNNFNQEITFLRSPSTAITHPLKKQQQQLSIKNHFQTLMESPYIISEKTEIK